MRNSRSPIFRRSPIRALNCSMTFSSTSAFGPLETVELPMEVPSLTPRNRETFR